MVPGRRLAVFGSGPAPPSVTICRYSLLGSNDGLQRFAASAVCTRSDCRRSSPVNTDEGGRRVVAAWSPIAPAEADSLEVAHT